MREFAIIGASGDVVAGVNRWTSTTDNLEIRVSQRARTTVNFNASKPLYFVLNGSHKDFKKLSSLAHAHFLGDGDSLSFDSLLTLTDSAGASIEIIEYGVDGTRLGQRSLRANQSGTVKFSKSTRFILPAIRLVGSGTVEFTRLHLESSMDREMQTTGEGVVYLAKNSRGKKENLSSSTRADDLLYHAEGLRSLSNQLVRDLSGLVTLPSPLVASPTVATSQAVGPDNSVSKTLTHSLLSQMASQLPSGTMPHHFKKIPLSAGIITDEYMFNFYKDVFENVVYLSPTNYRDTLDATHFDLILFVTCWKGMSNEEWRGVKFRETPMKALESILDIALSRGILSVFQSIEDPSNYEYFLPIAKKFDYVFTSDVDVIENYRNDVGHENVFYAEYGANPLVNHPAGSQRFDVNKVLFSGSYPERYPERTKDMNDVFESVLDESDDLVVIDRNFAIDGFDFPEKYRPYIIPPYKHAELQGIHKLFRYSLNFNSIKHSPTMCAMRVYELQAQGRTLASNYALSVFNKFPFVRLMPAKSKFYSSRHLTQPIFEQFLAQLSLYEVMASRTSFDVTNQMVSKMSLAQGGIRNEEVLVLCDNIEFAQEFADRQYGVSSQVTCLEQLNNRPEILERFGYVVSLDPNLDYGPFYLISRLVAFKYAAIDFATQEKSFSIVETVPKMHEYTSNLGDLSLTMFSTAVPELVEILNGKHNSRDLTGYLVDPFSVGEKSVRRYETRRDSRHETLTVVVPVHNNWKFLLGKCLPSLMNNESWSEMRVLLVDDGSSDGYTQVMINEIANVLPNVSVFEFGDEGSGSASRPRNKGIDLATTELVTFLDPDNEISPGGYDNLLARYREARQGNGDPVDFVSGYQVKVAEKVSITGRHAAGNPNRIKDPYKSFFDLGKFPVVSSQAAVIRTEFLREAGLRFVEGAVGQDTLFGWELLLLGKAVFTDEAFIIYYAERGDSVTNVVNISYFERALALEVVQVPKLKKLGVWKSFVDKHAVQFINNWYMHRYSRVQQDSQLEAATIIRKIAALYEIDEDQIIWPS